VIHAQSYATAQYRLEGAEVQRSTACEVFLSDVSRPRKVSNSLNYREFVVIFVTIDLISVQESFTPKVHISRSRPILPQPAGEVHIFPFGGLMMSIQELLTELVRSTSLGHPGDGPLKSILKKWADLGGTLANLATPTARALIKKWEADVLVRHTLNEASGALFEKWRAEARLANNLAALFTPGGDPAGTPPGRGIAVLDELARALATTRQLVPTINAALKK
jgi:hypothetical protein